MNKKFIINPLVIVGFVLVIIGSLLLLANFEVINIDWKVVLGSGIALGGLSLFAIYLLDHKHWWAIIPALVIITLGTLILLETFGSDIRNRFEPLVIFGFTGLAFWMIYINDNKHWWAIIPGGVLWSLGVAAFTPEGLLRSEVIFFLGVGLTFLLLYLLPNPTGKMKWALVPAGIIAGIGLILSFSSGSWLSYVSPAILIIGGIGLLFFALHKR